MGWQEDVRLRLKKHSQILFRAEDQPLLLLEQRIANMPRQAAVLWALEMAEETVCLLEKLNPDEKRPRAALELTAQWAAGQIKMQGAKKAILACHAAAKETADAELIAHFHAVGQACGTVHAVGHAIGYPIYDLTALIRRYGAENMEAVEARCCRYIERLEFWEAHYADAPRQWAAFLQTDHE